MSFIALIIALGFFVLGLVGTFLPVFPGVVLIWVGMFLYGLLTGFDELSVGFYVVQGLAAFLVILMDYLAAALGAQKFGGTKLTASLAAVGLIVGVVLFGPPGVIFGPFIGAFIGDLVQKKPPEDAFHSSIGTVVGLLGGALAKFLIEIVMIFWFFIALI